MVIEGSPIVMLYIIIMEFDTGAEVSIILEDICCYIDDIVITRVNKQEQLQNLEEILHRLEKNSLQIKKLKSEFLNTLYDIWVTCSVHPGRCSGSTHISYILRYNKAILNAPDSKNLYQLNLLNSYGKSFSNSASIVYPLNESFITEGY